MARLKKHVVAAAKAVGRAGEAQDIWNRHKGGTEIRQSFIEACGLTGLDAAATAAEAAAAHAVTAEKVADKPDRPARAADAVRANAAAQAARKAADDAQAETERFLQALEAAELADSPADPAVAIAAAKDKADADLQVVDEIAGEIDDDVAAYKAAVIKATKSSPTDGPDALATTVHTALAHAKAAHGTVVTEAAAGNLAATEVAVVANARVAAEAARDDLAKRAAALKRKKIIDDTEGETKVDAKAKKEKKKAKAEQAKAEKAGRFGEWLSKPLSQLQVLLASAAVVWFLFPQPFRNLFLVGAVFVLIVMIVSWTGQSRAGKTAAGLYGGLVGVGLLWILVLVPAMSTAPNSRADIIPSVPTPTATSSAKPVGDRPSQAELNAERTATAEASATEAANP